MAYSSIKISCLFIIFGALLSILLVPANAFCKLSAEAELNFVNFDVRDNTNQHLSAHSLTQRYSLLYEKADKIMDGRLGKYNVAIGYDWTTFDTTIKSTSGSENPTASRGHILYRGEILIDPKELPLRLSAYSRDMNRDFFSEDYSNLLGTMSSGNLTGSPQLATGIMDGLHLDSGATLVMGVKNGMTNGYNEMLRHFPMLMLDYRDVLNRDLNSQFPVHNRFSRLAFVSLNKVDNWFHYRILNYNDYINPDNNYKETQIQLGTVDQTMQRRWVDFSNWLQISADGQLTRRNQGASAAGSSLAQNMVASDSFTEFDLNLFGIARRDTWEARTFNNFNRLKEDNGKITYRTTVPLYASGTLSADTGWSSRFSYKDDHDNLNNQFTDVSGGYRIDAFKRAPFTLSQQLDLEHASSNDVEMLVVSAALETTSTARLSRTLSLGASYNVRNYSYSGAASASNFLDQTLRATAGYSPSNQTRWLLSQTARITSGTSQYVNSNILGATVISPQYADPRNNLGVNGPSFQSITELSLYWNPLARLNVGFSVNEDIYLPENAQKSYRTNLIQTADYYGANFKLTSRNTISFDSAEKSTSSNTFNSYNRANYNFSRNLDAHMSLSYNRAIDTSFESNTLGFEEGVNYYYYKTNGMTRKLFEINQAFDHVENSSTNSVITPSISSSAFSTPYSTSVNNLYRSSSSNFSLGAKYYPIRQLLLAAGTRYSFFSNLGDYALTYYGAIGLNFRLLQANLEYMYGTARADGRIEKKITANVRKIF